jgi:hypothetical protein
MARTGAEVSRLFYREAVAPPGPALRPYWNRAYRHIDKAIPEALAAGITDPEVARLPADVGSVEQWVDHVELLHQPDRRAGLSASYGAWMSPRPAEPAGSAGPLPGQCGGGRGDGRPERALVGGRELGG